MQEQSLFHCSLAEQDSLGSPQLSSSVITTRITVNNSSYYVAIIIFFFFSFFFKPITTPSSCCILNYIPNTVGAPRRGTSKVSSACDNMYLKSTTTAWAAGNFRRNVEEAWILRSWREYRGTSWGFNMVLILGAAPGMIFVEILPLQFPPYDMYIYNTSIYICIAMFLRIPGPRNLERYVLNVRSDRVCWKWSWLFEWKSFKLKMFKLQPETLLKPQKRTGTLTDRLNCSLMRTFPQCLPFGRPLVFKVTLHHPNQILSCLQKGFLSNPRAAGIQTYYDILHISTYIYIYLHMYSWYTYS